MTPQDEERRGEEARHVLENPLLQEAFRMIEERIVNQLAMVEIERERAEYLRTLLAANRKVKQYLEQIMFTGTMGALEDQRRRHAGDIVADWMSRIAR